MKIRSIFLTLIAIVSMTVSAQDMTQQIPPLPADEAVRVGKLDNGLTYYIRQNNWPENRVNFYIAQKVGSLQEEESQRGLAHFLEHMCFNGTENFPGNNIIRFCESIGVQFGSDLNAYTSIEETVYRIDNVPTDRKENIDSCLLVLRDWADGLLLEEEEIDKERGVIHEEWRLRTSAVMRMLERNLESLYPGTKYGRRFPIGTMEVIDNFKYQELRDYYERWYHPLNQGIMVVGNIDVDYVEGKIKELFSPIQVPENADPIVKVEVPDNDEAIVIVDHDKEMTSNTLEVFFKHDPFPDEMRGTMMLLINEIGNAAIASIMRDRLTEAAQEPGCPFTAASVSEGDYLFASTKGALSLDVEPKSLAQSNEAFKAALLVLKQACDHGFTATEFERFKQDFLSMVEKQFTNKDKRTNTQLFNPLRDNFLHGDAMPSIDVTYMIVQQLLPAIPVEAINESLKEEFPSDNKNVVILSLNSESEGDVYPTRESLLAVLDEVRATETTPYVDNVKSEPLMTTMPKAGKIKKEEQNDKYGYTKLTLSNGATVILKKTDYKLDQVILNGYGDGGQLTFPVSEHANLELFDDVISGSGLGNFSSTELQKALAGKIASANLGLGNNKMNLNGSSTPKDVETMLQLAYLKFTNIAKDQKSFDNIMAQYATQLKNRDINPDIAYSDSVSATIYQHNPRTAPLTLDDLDKVSYDRILQMAKERTDNAADWTFYIIGNYDEETIRPLICQYLGALPKGKKGVKATKQIDMADGIVDNVFKRKQETPKANAILVWHNDEMPYNLENSIKIDMVGQILDMIYLKKIREEESAAYSVGARGAASTTEYDHMLLLQAFCPMTPDKADLALQILKDEVVNMTKEVNEDMLTKVKEFMLKSIDDMQKTNSYWLNVISTANLYNTDLMTGYREIVAAQTADTLKAFMADFIKQNNRISVVMLPE